MLPARLKRTSLYQAIAASLFPLSGHQYPSPWYTPYKFRELSRVLRRPSNPAHLPPGYGRWLDERIIEYPWFFSRLPSGPGKLLDAGSALNFKLLLEHPKVREKTLTIMTLAPEEECFWRHGISYLYGDLRQTSLRADYFDWIVCISTLEHIGLDNTLLYTHDPERKENDPASYLAALRELHRVLRPGGSLFITVPFGRRDVRAWLQVFDREMVAGIVDAFQPVSCSQLFFHYGPAEGWQSCLPGDIEAARYFDPRTDQPWEGSPVAAEAVACLELTK